MFKIATFNQIASIGLARFPSEHYQFSHETPDAILLRSHPLTPQEIPQTIKAISRAGAGTNNIPIDYATAQGIPVFNTPGANANAVKELVLCGILMASRNIPQACQLMRELTHTLATTPEQTLDVLIEDNKKQLKGFELPGKTLGVIGLGAIGVKVANAALSLGMKVIGFDPALTVKRAWELSPEIQHAESLEQLLKQSMFITLHVPLNDHTRHLLNRQRLQCLPKNAILLNFSRQQIIEEAALQSHLATGELLYYVTDFPSPSLLTHDRVLCFPHLGASTQEAEDNCAVMAADQTRNFLEHGTIINSVNFPDIELPRTNENQPRLIVINANVPNMVAQISSVLAQAQLNIIDLLNKSKGEIAISLFDVSGKISDTLQDQIRQIKGVLSVRSI